MSDNSNLFSDYQDLKLKTHKKHNEIINTVKEWFEENHPEIMVLSVYVNDRVIIDQLCLTLHMKLPGEVIDHFCEEFGLELSTGIYRLRREYGRTAIVGNPYVDYEEWRYSFKLK